MRHAIGKFEMRGGHGDQNSGEKTPKNIYDCPATKMFFKTIKKYIYTLY